MLFIYITRLASKEIFSPSNKIHREVGRAKDLSAPRYVESCARTYTILSFGFHWVNETITVSFLRNFK